MLPYVCYRLKQCPYRKRKGQKQRPTDEAGRLPRVSLKANHLHRRDNDWRSKRPTGIAAAQMHINGPVQNGIPFLILHVIRLNALVGTDQGLRKNR